MELQPEVRVHRLVVGGIYEAENQASFSDGERGIFSTTLHGDAPLAEWPERIAKRDVIAIGEERGIFGGIAVEDPPQRFMALLNRAFQSRGKFDSAGRGRLGEPGGAWCIGTPIRLPLHGPRSPCWVSRWLIAYSKRTDMAWQCAWWNNPRSHSFGTSTASHARPRIEASMAGRFSCGMRRSGSTSQSTSK